MFKERYRHMMDQIMPSNELLEKVRSSNIRHKLRWRLMCPIAAMMAACFVLGAAMPALAANVEPIYQTMYHISPSMAQFFMPIHLSDEKDGIRMEVESVYIHSNTAEVYITLQDLTGDRIDESIDLNDSYDIHVPCKCQLSGCELIGYDKQSKTARFYIRIDAYEGTIPEDSRETALTLSDMKELKITVSIGNFFSHKKRYNDIEIPIDLMTAEKSPKTQTVALNGWSTWDYYEDAPTSMEVLIPSEPRNEFPIKEVNLTGIGYIDNKLHVQIESNREANLFNGQAFFELVKEDGTKVKPKNTCGYYGDSGLRYDESIFDIPPEEIGNYKLTGTFVILGEQTVGNWRITFPIAQEK